MPTDPLNSNNSTGPSDQQPTPNVPLSDAVNQLKNLAENQAAFAKNLQEIMKNITPLADKAAESIKTIGLELKADLEHAENMEDRLKAISAAAKLFQKGIFSIKNLKQAEEALAKIKEAQESILKIEKAGSIGHHAAAKSIEKITEQMAKYRKEIEASGDALHEMSDTDLVEFKKLLHDAVPDAEKLARTFKTMSMSHVTRQVHSVAQNLSKLGIGKNFATKIDKYAAGAELKSKVAEAKKSRLAGNTAAAQKKKDEAIDYLRNNSNLNLGDMSSGSEARKAIARRMGLSRRATKSFVAGDESSAFKHGGGGMLSELASGGAGLVEGGVGTIVGAAEKLAPVLAVLDVLKDVWDKQIKQNKGMEAGLGKAGLFSQGTPGFMDAQRNLTPGNFYNILGLNFDRNLKIAQALQEGGRGLTELVTGKGEKRAGSEFGPGGFGQFQRIVAGAGRMAGLTDAEGVQQTLKLLDQYSQTMQSSEDFFIKIRKGADAAGLSTTKYIAIIDDVNSHFSRMNKNLDGTLNMLTELSKTGRIGAEDLKQYMDFLTAGGPAKGMADVPLNAFARMGENPLRRKLHRDQAQYDVGEAIKKAIGTGMLKKDDPRLKILSEGGPAAQRIVDQLDYDLTGNTALSPDQRQERTNAINALERSTGHLGRVKADRGAIAQSFGDTVSQSVADLAIKNQDLLERAVKSAGGTMKEYMDTGPEEFATTHESFIGLLEAFKLSPENALQQHRGQRQAAETMLRSFTGVNSMKGDEQQQTVKTAKTFLRELNRDQKIKLGLTDKVINELKPDQLEKIFQEHGKEFSEIAPGMEATYEFVMRSRMMGKDVSGDVPATLEQARKVGMVTQTTGEMIASAFSKWFNDIIDLMTRILDALPWSHTSASSRAAAAAATQNPMFQNRKTQAEQILRDQQAAAEVVLQDTKASGKDQEKANEAFAAASDALGKLQITPQDLDDVKNLNNTIDNLIKSTAPATTKAGAAINVVGTSINNPNSASGAQLAAANVRDMQQAINTISDQAKTLDDTGSAATAFWDARNRILARQNIAGETYGALVGAPGITLDADSGNVTVDRSASKNLTDAIKQLVAAGAITGTGVDKSGNITYHINNYSAEITQNPTASGVVSAQTNEQRTTAPTVKK
jgi:hypothetical protein